MWLAGGHSGWLPAVAWARLRTLDSQHAEARSGPRGIRKTSEQGFLSGSRLGVSKARCVPSSRGSAQPLGRPPCANGRLPCPGGSFKGSEAPVDE